MPENFENHKEELTDEEWNQLIDKVEDALNNPPTEEEFFEAEKMRNEAVAKFMKGGPLAELLKEEEKPMKGVVDIPSAEVLRLVMLQILGDAKLAQEQADHEREHYDSAIQHGLNPKFIIRFLKNKNSSTDIIPGVSFKLPEIGDEEEMRQAIINITTQVSELSLSDEQQLKSYKKEHPGE